MMDVIGILFLIGVYVYFASIFYRDGWNFNDVSIPRKISVIGYICYLSVLFVMTPSGYREFISDVGFRYGAITYFYPAIGFTVTSFPYQIAQFKFNSMLISEYSLDIIFSTLGWVMVMLTVGVQYWSAQ